MTGAALFPFGLGAVVLAFGTRLAAADPFSTEWSDGSGSWSETAKWSAGLPTVRTGAAIGGNASVVIPPGNFAAALLDVGCRSRDRARVEVNGGQLLLRQDSLRIGEYTGSEGTFVLKDGAMHCAMDVFVGAATATAGRMTKGTLIIQGGSFVGLTLTVGEGLGAESRVAIEGYRATAIIALEFASFLAMADPGGQPGESTLSFTLDDHGVTPITLPSRWDGLHIVHDGSSHCRLRIALGAVPPREDVILVAGRVPIEGTFDDLPEGAPISAEYAGWSYRWTLTYRGGPTGHDLVLQNKSEYPANAPVTHVRASPEIPQPLWANHPVAIF